MSDGEGIYRALELEPGRYHVRFALGGFAPLERAAVVILLGRTIEINTTLAISSVVETVQVATDRAPLTDMSFDQAHFNHDFRAFAGLTPSAYLRDRMSRTHVVVSGA